ncbi:phytanoyl-CoA dioxygenase family protein [Rhodoferax koreense]|uniref:phytanoyl-CoA dioxygenase family protein n=1 Tax=Rhodoferax koreensis TaxID=1842727 RepID=UPI0009FADE65|nr:phytanoyl-CoA dioxygenase family protein [Rhodoferax koreense]
MATLTPEDIANYHERGYLIPRFTLPKARIDHLRATLDQLIRDNPGVRPEKLVSAHVVGQGGAANPEGVKGSKAFLDLAMEPEILDMVEQLIGPDIILWGCHVFCKPAGDGQETPWHQDGHYWPIRPLANVTVWVALDPSTRENGCLRVIPGSHKAQVTHAHLKEDREDLVLSQRTDTSAFDENDAVDLELQPGQMSMHEVYMIHGAEVNRSTQRRAGVALRYMPGTSVFERNLNPADGQSGVPVAFATRPLWLLRGQDRTGRNDFKIGFPEASQPA